MKKIFCTVFCLLFAATSFVFAQKTATESAAETTARWAKKYNLNAAQTEKLLVITERKLKNEAEFETLRTTNYKLYRAKHQANISGTKTSLKWLLGKEQREIFAASERDLRLRKAQKTAELKTQRKTTEEMEDVLIEME